MATLSYYNILQRANPLYFSHTILNCLFFSSTSHAIHEPAEKKPLKQTTNKALQKRLSPYEIEKYTVMCNSQIKHADNIYHYN